MSDILAVRADSAAAEWSSPLLRLTMRRLMLWLWLSAAAVDFSVSAVGGWTLATPFRVAATYLFGFLLSLAVQPMMARAARDVSTFSLFRMLAIAVPCGLALFVFDVFGRAYAHGESPFHVWQGPRFARLRLQSAYLTMIFVFQSALVWLLAFARALQTRERELTAMRLLVLRLQLNPHFLSNTLNAVAALARDGETAAVEEAIERLFAFLQIVLENESEEEVPLAAEIDVARAYLDVEAVRFAGRMIIMYDCDAGLADAPVPNFILQPLVENAVKHAVAVSKHPVTIVVAAAARGGALWLSVRDDGVGTGSGEGAGQGLGLRIVAERLATLHGASAALEAGRGDAGFTATVRLPLAPAPKSA